MNGANKSEDKSHAVLFAVVLSKLPRDLDISLFLQYLLGLIRNPFNNTITNANVNYLVNK